jgi:NAD-dependent DNA ligase
MMEIDEDDLKDAAFDDKNCLEGLTIVLSGEFELISRPKLEEFIKEHGGRNTSAVSGKTDYLVVGYKLEDGREVTQGSKYSKAKQLGTGILTEKEFEELIRSRTGNPDFTLSARKGLMEEVK